MSFYALNNEYYQVFNFLVDSGADFSKVHVEGKSLSFHLANFPIDQSRAGKPELRISHLIASGTFGFLMYALGVEEKKYQERFASEQHNAVKDLAVLSGLKPADDLRTGLVKKGKEFFSNLPPTNQAVRDKIQNERCKETDIATELLKASVIKCLSSA